MSKSTKQSGAVLVVTLLLVFMLGVLGASAMNSSLEKTESSIANEIEKNTFMVVESAVVQAYRTTDVGTLKSGQENSVDVVSTNDLISLSVTARKDGILPAINTSLGLFGLSSYSIRAVGQNDTVNTRRTIISGAVQRVPLGQ